MSQFQNLYWIIHRIRHAGPGATNRGGDGSLKSITIGGDARSRNSGQKGRNDLREYLKRYLELPVAQQTRSLGEWVVSELIAKGIDPETAEKLSQDLMDNFLNHSKAKKDKKAKKGKKAKVAEEGSDENTAPEKEDESKSEIVRVFPEEIEQLKKAIDDLASGVETDPTKFKFLHIGTAIDLALFGRMRPTFIAGAVSFGEEIGIERMAVEEDFFSARDDYSQKPFYKYDLNAAGHTGTKQLVSSNMYLNVQINVAQLYKNLDNDEELIQKFFDWFIKAIYEAGSSSGSVGGSHTHTLASYIMVEALRSEPRSLEPAFERPVTSVAEGVAKLKALKKRYDDEIPAPYREFSAYFDDSGKMVDTGSLSDLKGFIKEELKNFKR